MKNYQPDYANLKPEMYNQISRQKKAHRIIKTLSTYYGADKLKSLSVLDIGSSTGIIDATLAPFFKSVTGIDFDDQAVNFAKKTFKIDNLKFSVGDAMNLDFESSSFNIIICTHIYEHVPNPSKLFKEIRRVLKPGGICYLAAVNKWWPVEPHYKLLFLSYFPKKIANFYIKTFRKADFYYETLESYWRLKQLTCDFKRIELTDQILRHPKEYGYQDIFSNSILKIAAFILSPVMKFFAPTFFWILIKKG